MKKIFHTAILGFFVGTVGFAQTQRTILYEQFAGENCPDCAFFNPFVNATVHKAGNAPNKIVKINFQGNIPSTPPAGSL